MDSEKNDEMRQEIKRKRLQKGERLAPARGQNRAEDLRQEEKPVGGYFEIAKRTDRTRGYMLHSCPNWVLKNPLFWTANEDGTQDNRIMPLNTLSLMV